VKAPALPEINLSQIQEWNKCRYRWSLRYERLIDRRSIHGPMDKGSVVHAGIAAGIRHFGTQETFTKALLRRTDTAALEGIETEIIKQMEKLGGPQGMTPEERAQMVDIRETAVEVVRRSLVALDLPKWKTIYLRGEPLIEKKLWLRTKLFRYHCTPDWVAQDQEDNTTWILDYKIRKAFTPPEAEEVNVQFPAYQYVLERHGVHTVGSIMFQVKANKESLPKLNLNGAMSRARIACTWDTYAKALVAHDLNPDDYVADMKPKLDTEFYRYTPVARNQFHVNAIWKNMVIPAAHEMISNPLRYRHMQYMNCNGCWARDFCLGELMDEDTDFMLQTQYVDLTNPAPRVILRPQDFENMVIE
jgi:hypothetical protein